MTAKIIDKIQSTELLLIIQKISENGQIRPVYSLDLMGQWTLKAAALLLSVEPITYLPSLEEIYTKMRLCM